VKLINHQGIDFFRIDTTSFNPISHQSAASPDAIVKSGAVVRKPAATNSHLGQDALLYVGIELPEP
jgi:hypothetical protein